MARTASPKYILGESYGGFRAAKVARALQQHQGIVISGIVMVSPLLEGAFTFGGTRFALGAALQLPSLAAAELERKGKFSKEKLAEAEHFALTDYLTTLAGRAAAGRGRQGVLCTRRAHHRAAGRRGRQARTASSATPMSRICAPANSKIVSHYDATFAVDDPYPGSGVGARPRSAARRRGARLWRRLRRPMRATSSASRPR